MHSHTIISRIRWLYSTMLIGDIGTKMFGRTISLSAVRTRELRNFIQQQNARIQQQDKTGIELSDEAQSILQDIQTLMKSGEKLG